MECREASLNGSEWGRKVVGNSEGKAPGSRGIILPQCDFITNLMARRRRSHVRIAKIVFGSGFIGRQVSCLSAVVEDESPAVADRDLLGLPDETLVVALGLCTGGVPFLVEPVEVRVVIRDPFLDGLPRWLDGLHGFDVEGRRRWAGKMDDSFPEAVETEKELGLAGAQEGADGFHGALAAGALERVATPDFEDEVTPERAHVAGSALGRRWDEDELDGACVFGGGLGLMRVANPRSLLRRASRGWFGI